MRDAERALLMRDNLNHVSSYFLFSFSFLIQAMRGAARVLVWPGDGIGPEITSAAVRVLESSGAALEWHPMPSSPGPCGVNLSETHLEAFDDCKTMFKGPLTIASGHGGVSIRNKTYSSGNQVFRKIFQLYANIRPAKSYAGVETPFKLDWVTFRENTEDVYTAEERFVDADTVEGIKRNSRSACRRIALQGLQYAKDHGRKKVTFVHKA